jgi:hypothetical protein
MAKAPALLDQGAQDQKSARKKWCTCSLFIRSRIASINKAPSVNQGNPINWNVFTTFITSTLCQTQHNIFASKHTMSQAPSNTTGSAAPEGYAINASIEFDRSQFHVLEGNTYIMAKVSPAGGIPSECWFRLTGGTQRFPTEMTVDFRPRHQAVGVFNADMSQGGPAIWRDVPVPGRDKVIGKLAVS